MMFDRWYKTMEAPYGGGMAIKTMDCKDAEQTIIQALEGHMEGVTKVVYGNQWYLNGYKTAYNNDGYEFFTSDESNMVNLDSWKYVMMEKWNDCLFVYVTDIKPTEY